MKNFCFLLIVISFLVSCNNSKKYEGKWEYNHRLSSDKNEDSPHSLLIKNDSIKFIFWNGFDSKKHPLKIKNGKFNFKGLSIPIELINDTLKLNGINSFVRYSYDDSIPNQLWGKLVTKVNLPKIKTVSFSTEKCQDKDHPKYHVLFGKRFDNNEFSLQLNDKYAEMQDLGRFFFECRIARSEEIIPFPESVLYIEETTPMKYIEDIFYNLSIINQLKLSFVNNIHLKFNDSLGLYYEYEKLSKKLPAFRSDVFYSTNTTDNPMQPPPPPPYFPMFDNENLESKFILLKNDIIYFNDKIISTLQLKSIIKPWIENNNAIFSLYDLESTYGNFLEMTAIINSIYQEVRENQSKLTFNKTLKELNREEYNEIKLQNPMYHIWSYSVPHYNSVIEQENSFFGLKVNKKM